MKLRFLLSVLWLHLFILTMSFAEKGAQEWAARGDAAFASALKGEQSFQEAIRCYTQSILETPDTILLYNLGNSLYHEQLYPEALIAYARALYLEPENSRIRVNRDLTLKKLNLKTQKRSVLERIIWFLPANTGLYRVWLLILPVLILLLLWALRIRIRKKKFPPLLPITIGFVLLMIISILTWEKTVDSQAWIYGDEIVLREGDSTLFESSGNYGPGTAVDIRKTRGLWAEVKITGTSNTGWIRRDELMTFDDLVDKFR